MKLIFRKKKIQNFAPNQIPTLNIDPVYGNLISTSKMLLLLPVNVEGLKKME
jgi:hypothetical protein